LAQVSLTTYHNNQARDGWNQNETILTTANVNSAAFGKLFSNAVDGQVYAQPLYMPNLTIGGGTHNVVFVVTEHDSAYAFDADSAGVTYWHDSYIGGVTMTVAQADVNSCSQITPEIGITDTPVIDPSTGTMYFVAMTKTVSGGVTNFLQQLHAVDLSTGAEKFNSPTVIQAVDPKNAAVTFIARAHKERCALALVNGVVYTSWTSHCDFNNFGAYHGWVIGYNAANISQQMSVYNTTPTGTNPEGSLWESGNGPSVDSAGNLYYLTSNGNFDQTAPVTDYSQCFLKLNTAGNAVTVLDYFSPMNEATLSSGDQDIGSAGQCLLPASWGSAAHPNLMLGADKPGDLYVVDTANFGHFNAGSNNIPQMVVSIGGRGYTSPAIYSNGTTKYVYWGMTAQPLKAFTFANGLYVTPFSSQTAANFSGQGCVPSVSSNGNTNGIVWALASGSPVVLHAYDATNLGTELYNSTQAAGNRDSAVGGVVKFAPPSIVNGKVFVPTANSLVVYGLLAAGTPTPTGSPTATRTATASPTRTSTNSPTATPTRTPTTTATNSPSRTATMTPTNTPGNTATASRTPSNSPTATGTNTAGNTATNTPTRTPTNTLTNTPSRTPTSTATPTSTPTTLNTATKTPSPTSTQTLGNTATKTPTPTATLSPTNTGTSTSTATLTATPSSSPTGTPTSSATNTRTNTPADTPTKTPTATPTDSPMNTPTTTPTHTGTAQPSATASRTPSNSPTTTPSMTSTTTGTNTPAATPTNTATSSSTASPTNSPINTATPSDTTTPTASASSTPTRTATASPTLTGATPATNTATPTLTNSPTVTASLTPTASSSPTNSPTATKTPTLSNTPTFSLTPTLANTATPTSTPTPSPTNSPTFSPTTVPTSTLTPTISPTFSSTPGTTSTPVIYPNPAPGGAPVTLVLNLDAQSDVRVQIYTLAFRKVEDKTVPHVPAGLSNLPIPLVDRWGKTLANGLYYLVVTANGKRWVLKLLIFG